VQVSLPCGIFCHCRDSCLCRALVSIFAVAHIFVVRFSPISWQRSCCRALTHGKDWLYGSPLIRV
jgi:hypothetical protein